MLSSQSSTLSFSIRYEWYQNEDNVTLTIYTKDKVLAVEILLLSCNASNKNIRMMLCSINYICAATTITNMGLIKCFCVLFLS